MSKPDEIANLKKLNEDLSNELSNYRRDYGLLESNFRSCKSNLDQLSIEHLQLKEQLEAAQTELSTTKEDLARTRDMFPRLDWLINGLSQRCDALVGDVRKAKEDK